MGSKPVGISGSRAASLLGLNQFSTAFETWQIIIEETYPGINKEKFNFTLPADPDNAAIRWGSAFESAIINLCQKVNAGTITDLEGFYTHKKLKYATCHIDGRYKSSGILHEGKTTSIWNFNEKFGEPGTDKIPQYHQVQVQHNMLVTGVTECLLSVLVFPKRVEEFEAMDITIKNCNIELWAQVLKEMGYFHVYYVKADKDIQKMLIEFYKKIWTDNIKGQKIIEPADYEDMKRMIPNPIGTIVMDDTLNRWYSEYKHIGKELGKTGFGFKRREELKVLILKRAKKINKGIIDDDSKDKWIFRDSEGKKIGSYNGKTFR